MLTVRDLVTNPKDTARITGETVPLLALYSLLLVIVVWCVAPLVSPNHLTADMLRIVAVSTALASITPEWLLQSKGSFRALAWSRFLGQACYGVSAAFLVTSGVDGTYRYAWLNALGIAVTCGLIWLAALRLIGRFKLNLHVRDMLSIIRRTGSFTLSLVMIRLYYSADFVLLGFLASAAAVGQYTVAYKLPLAFLGLASLWVTVFFPHASAQPPNVLQRQLSIITMIILGVVAPLCAGSAILGTPLMVALFGPSYHAAGAPFSILMVGVAFAAVDMSIGQVILATGHERRFAVGVSLGAGMNLALNVLLIPTLGTSGSALATVAAEALVLVFMAFTVTSLGLAPRLLWSRVIFIALATALMAAALLLVDVDGSVFARIAIGLGIYGVALFLTGAVRRSDLTDLRQARLL